MFPPGFDDWASETFPKIENESINFANFESLDLDNNREQILNAFFNNFSNRDGFWPSVVIQPSKLQWKRINWTLQEKFPGLPTSDKKCDIWNLQVGGVLQEFTLTGAAVHSLFLNASIPSVFRIKECLIGHLQIAGQSPVEVELIKCEVGTLQLEQGGRVKGLEVNGGAIADIRCLTPSQQNPFSGSVRLKTVMLPSSKTHTKLFKGPQCYRNLLAHLEALNNLVTANKIRAMQMQAEREDDKGIAWLVHWVYGTFASYGTNPGRPLIWLLVLYAVVVLSAYFEDASYLNPSFGHGIGQYEVLADSEKGRWHRAGIMPFQSIVNPFGVFFNGRKLLMPNSLGWGIALTIYGLISDLLVLMFAFCIRRRFKVS